MNSINIGPGSQESGNRSQDKLGISGESMDYNMDLTPKRVLLVDDQPEVLWPLINFFENEGYTVKTAERAEEALDLIPDYLPQIVFLDVKMPGMNGLEALERIRANFENIITFVLTGNESIKDAVQAIKTGAYDYFSKPYHVEEIKFSILKAMEDKRIKEELLMLRKQLKERFDFGSIITADPKMFEIFDRLRKIAPSDRSVLITGDSGTGKELLARAIHYNSNRNQGPFKFLNCAAIPDTLFESEMFGYDKGAFTGAEQKKKGFFEMAHQGTLFLDELGNLRPESQSKLLRAIEELKIFPLGGKEYIDLDLRLISATNTDLEVAKNAGTFREDLYFRINQFNVHIPPLRERPNDILLLARYFLNDEEILKAKGKGPQVQDISPEVVEILTNYSWPGNVRELKNVIQSASFLAEETIFPKHLHPYMLCKNSTGKGIRISLNVPNGYSLKRMERYVVAHAGRDYIERVLVESNYQKTQACKKLDVNPNVLSKKIKEYNIRTQEVPDDFAQGWIGESIRPGMTFKELDYKIGLDVERLLIIRALHEFNGNKTKTARKLEIDYKTLLNKIQEFQIFKEDIQEIQLPECVTDITTKDPSCPYKQIVSQIRQEMEKALILLNLRYTNWDKAKAVRILDIDYKTIYNKMHKYGLIEKK